MKKAMRKIFVFLFCWILWIFPAIGDLKESGCEYARITCLFLSIATVALIYPFLFSAIHYFAVIINPNVPLTVFDFLSLTFPVGLLIYLTTGITYHIAVIGYGGASWYIIYENIKY